MNLPQMEMTETGLHEFITRGAARLTQRDVHRLVAEMPDLRDQFSRMRESAYPKAEEQLLFLSEVVDQVWTETYRDMPFGAALEAAFAVAYFICKTDLIPDSLGSIELIDDIVIVQLVIARNATAYETFRSEAQPFLHFAHQ